jgi:predicted dehydrogenase
MPERTLRIGLVGAGHNTRLKHLPGLRAVPGVEVVAVCNRRPESTAEIARAYRIPRTFERWQDLVADPALDAVVVGTWPYLHCPVTLAALEAGKHVLTEARLSCDAVEARRMREAARRHPHLVAQVVPSPYGLAGHSVVCGLLQNDFLGCLLEVLVVARTDALADPETPLGWRQDAVLSGLNALTLGIIQETLGRWTPPVVRVLAQTHAFTPVRIDPGTDQPRPVGTPDCVQVLAILANGARATYHVSGVSSFGQDLSITLSGTKGMLHYDLVNERLRGAPARAGLSSCRPDDLPEIPIQPDRALAWQVEADWIRSIREGTPVRFSTLDEGVAYMEFTEAVAQSSATGLPVSLPVHRPS